MGFAVEAPIPRHITGIYVFAVVNLLAMLCISRVDADIIVIDTMSNETAKTYQDLQAKFGPDFPSKGLEGRLVYAEPDQQACGSLKPPPSNDTKYWILLIARGGMCQFADKVLNAQLHNYSAVIVHNYEHKEERIPMGGGNNGSKVKIPSTFVGWTNGMELWKQYDYKHREYIIKILEDEAIDFSDYLWPFLLVLAICILMVMIFLLIKFLRDYTHRSLSRLSNKHLKKIPVRKFRKGDYYDTCAICLDEYEEGEKIRVLPCDHVYHRKCIDPWLTKNKKTCPVCKRRVIPGRDADSESGSDAEGGDVAATSSENTPLLRGVPAQPRSHHSMASMSGTTRIHPLQEGDANNPSDPHVEYGAVGGEAVSSRVHRLPQVVSLRGSIQNDRERMGPHPDRKRKRQDRNGRSRREETVAHGEEEAAGTSMDSDVRRHRERRKRRKDKRKVDTRPNLQEVNEVGGVREEDTNRAGRNTCEGEEANNFEQGPVETNTTQIKVNEPHVNSNADLSGQHEVVVPVLGRRREMNEVV